MKPTTSHKQFGESESTGEGLDRIAGLVSNDVACGDFMQSMCALGLLRGAVLRHIAD